MQQDKLQLIHLELENERKNAQSIRESHSQTVAELEKEVFELKKKITNIKNKRVRI